MIEYLLVSVIPQRALPWLIIPMLLMASSTPHQAEDDLHLAEWSLEDLVTTPVSLASRSEEALFDVSAAVAVVTGEELRRSGVTSVAEALRLVPGMQVARLDASKWAISVRGSNSRFTNNMLVQIDGRSVYTPVFSGVYWEVQDLLLDNVEQIEVIRGPGATLWGANAFFGVVNIITKSAAKTRGTLVTAGGGSEERAFGAVRGGRRLGEHGDIRLYARFFDRDQQVDLAGDPSGDEWRGARGGLRADWTLPSDDHLMVQAAIYETDLHNGLTAFLLEPPYAIDAEDDVDIDGGHVLGRWERRFSATHDMALQVYFDRTRHRELYLRQRHHTFDVDFQHRSSPGPRHELIWGSGLRFVDANLDSTFMLSFDSSQDRFTYYNAFAQDDISLRDGRVHLTLGGKVEHNPFTGLELQPNARVRWAPRDRQSLWAAVSRAVRTPARVETDGELVMGSLTHEQDEDVPIFVVGAGSEDLCSQKVIAIEAGYRLRPIPRLFIDIATFVQYIDDIVEVNLGTPVRLTDPDRLILPTLLNNRGQGRSAGAEVLVDWEARRGWLVQGTYSYLNMRRNDAPSVGFTDRSPHHLQLRSRSTLAEWWTLDATARYVAERAQQAIDGYLTLDARLAWRSGHGVEISVVGQNLLAAEHQEGITQIVLHRTAQIQRGVYGQIRWER
ncbi:MAG: TonB-dependent receptor [Gemmatimonadetes bacterium]|nr:TonB-dependent receptor [Gemmatimonadota bacterium]MBT5588345.1 TonB-dependent receptor [Gemmatimonadota bacterium]